MTSSRHPLPANRLLAALSLRSRERFVVDCDPVKLTFAEVLCESGERINQVYFPTEGFVSLLTPLDDGARLEVGIVGDEGMVGTPLLLGVNTSPLQAVVQGAGIALRMNAAAFRKHCRQDDEIQKRLNLYLHVSIRQLAQTAACTRYHSIEPRLARWLLMSRDRAHADQFHLTHEFLAYMLGVRRVGVTQAARGLHARGFISYIRGSITILDNTGLEKVSCSCYRRGNEMYEQTLGKPRGGRARAAGELAS
ncbi:CRP-like cAMP-binding protein [Povalibacter uvarum]|uniref:CRP-like cAMP-binding protein n=1 Tax=Povalibacter uvarum TaxID=732238 RepID=A0A841HHN6_9GAMM|nr:Crp/Fnr family transcriptional regulator [Povalibacter uvarum]MBB6092487.1 CRP-like cAMP-binding protein [Povalibacter uvarum]